MFTLALVNAGLVQSITSNALEIVHLPPSQLPTVLLTAMIFNVEHLLMILPGHTIRIQKHGHCYSVQRPLGLPGSNILSEKTSTLSPLRSLCYDQL